MCGVVYELLETSASDITSGHWNFPLRCQTCACVRARVGCCLQYFLQATGVSPRGFASFQVQNLIRVTSFARFFSFLAQCCPCLIDSGLVGSTVGRVPREQKMLKGFLGRIIYHPDIRVEHEMASQPWRGAIPPRPSEASHHSQRISFRWSGGRIRHRESYSTSNRAQVLAPPFRPQVRRPSVEIRARGNNFKRCKDFRLKGLQPRTPQKMTT